MSEEIYARHIASFLEHDGALNEEEILQNLRTVTAMPNRSILDCHLAIIENEYLTVRIESDKDPSECFDLRCIDGISGFTSKSKGSNFTYLLVFRFHASKLTGGECPNEIHIFDMDDEAMLEWAVDTIFTAVNGAKHSRTDTQTGNAVKRSVSKKKNAVDRLEKMRRVPHSIEEGTEDLLKVLNNLLDEVENFEANLHDAISFQISNSSKADRSLWRDSLCPPTLEVAKENIERIRTCINYTAELQHLIVDPGPGDLLNRLFESLWWIQKICDCNKVLHFHSNLIRSVWRPPFNNQTIKLLREYLEPANKSFWNDLGNAWTQPGGKADPQPEFDNENRIKSEKTYRESDLKPELTIRDYGYYKPAPTISSEITMKEEKPVDIEGFINGVRGRGGKLVVVKQRHLSEAARELSVNIGEVLEVLDDGDDWCCLRTPAGATGHVPKKSLEVLEDHKRASSRPRSTSRHRSQSPLLKSKSIDVKKTKSRSSSRSDTEPINNCNESCAHRSSRHNCRPNLHPMPEDYTQNQTNAYNQPQVQYMTQSQYNTMQAQPVHQRNFSQPLIQTADGTQPPVIILPSQAAQGNGSSAQIYNQPLVQQGNKNQPSVIVLPSQTAGGSTHYIVTPATQTPTPRRLQQSAKPQNVIVPIPVPSTIPHVMSSPMIQSMGYQMPYSVGQQMYGQQMYPGMMTLPMNMYNTQLGPYGTNQYGNQHYPFRPIMDQYSGAYDSYNKNYLSDLDRYQYAEFDRNHHGARSRPRSQSPKHKSNKQKSKNYRKQNKNRFSSDSDSSSESAEGSHKNKKHNDNKSSSSASANYGIPPAPSPPPPMQQTIGSDTYDIISQAVRKQRLLGHKPPAHTDTLNKELKERIRSMQIGLGNGLKPAVKRSNDASRSSTLRSNNDSPGEISRLAATFETSAV